MGELSALLPTWADAPADVEFSRFFCRDAARGEFSRLELVAPDKVPRRRSSTASGRAALLHSIAHIEYAAVDLALDHALRFAGMPTRYYLDWLRVAADEARHFEMLRAHLQTLGYDYGDFPAHAGLWQMAARTAHDVLARMAMVPVCSRRGDLMPLRLFSANWLRLVTRLPYVCSRSYSMTKKIMFVLAMAGSDSFAMSAGLNQSWRFAS